MTQEENPKEIRLQGIPLSPGIAIGKIVWSMPREDNVVPEIHISQDKIDREVHRFYEALKSSQKELLILRSKMKQESGDEAAAIVSVHLEMIQDPIITHEVEEGIRTQRKNSAYVFKQLMGHYQNKLSCIPDEFFKERVKDFQDITSRVMQFLNYKQTTSLKDISFQAIVFADELSASDAVEANPNYIQALVCKQGVSSTAHVAILARAKQIPFVSNVAWQDGIQATQAIIDGYSGEVILNPTVISLAAYQKKKRDIDADLQQLDALPKEAFTADGVKISLWANIEVYDELNFFDKQGIEGIGLLRTESLFMQKSSLPSEEEQFQMYLSIVQAMKGAPVVIRTFDIGGDKWNQLPFETNPFLGCRAIRFMFEKIPLFKDQIRAILKASHYGCVKLLLPMISRKKELIEAKKILEEVKHELEDEKIPFDPKIQVGCMIEVPSAALTSDLLLQECDFLSIGTNDLVQYTLAVDRTNLAMSYLYTPAHLSILRLLEFIIKEGVKAQKPVALCGEIASNPLFTQLLLGLGLVQLSIPCTSFSTIKRMISQISFTKAQAFAQQVLQLSSSEEIQTFLHQAYLELRDEPLKRKH